MGTECQIRNGCASHAPGAAVRKFHALMHPLIARLNAGSGKLLNGFCMSARARAQRPTACVGEKTATFHTSFRVSQIFSRQNDHKRSPPFYDAFHYPNNFTKTIYPYEIMHTRP